MESSDLPDFVFGVINRRPHASKEDLEEVKRNRFAIRSLKWLSWCSGIIANVSKKDLNASGPFSGGNLREHVLILQQFQSKPATQDQLLMAFETLQKFACHLGIFLSFHTWWSALFSTVQGVFCVALESQPSLQLASVESCLSLIHLILNKVSYLKRNASVLWEPFLYVCCTACKVLLLERRINEAHFLSALITKAHSTNQERNETSSGDVLSNSDWIYLTAACCCMLEPRISLQHLERVSNSYYHCTVSYFKVCLHHDLGEYDKALELSSPLTAESAYKELPSELRSHLCDAVGSCLYKTGMQYESVDWFSKAVDEDPGHIVALLHMADAYRSLKNVNAERAALRVMAQGSLNITASHGDKALASSDVYEASLSEALYILGFRLLAAGLDEEAADIFDSFIREYNIADDTEWILIPKPSLSQMYVEAAHAQLRAKRYSRCKELVNAVLNSYPGATLDPRLFGQSDGNSSAAWKMCATNYFGSLLCAVASMHLKQDVNEEAENIFKRMFSVVSLLHKEDVTPVLSQDREEHRWMLELVSQAYGNLSVLKLRRGLNVDALHSLKASLVAWPDNLDSLYNYVLLLLKLDKNRKALQVWNTAKGRGLAADLNREDSSYWQFNATLDRLKVLDRMLA